MNLLIVSPYYTPELGAAPSRITNMAEGLEQEGASVEVLTCLPNYPKGHIFNGYRGCISRHEQINGVSVHRYWTYSSVSKNPVKRMLSMLTFSVAIWGFGLRIWRILKYDRVIIQSPPLPVAFSALILFRCLYRRCTILNVSDLWPISAVELGAIKQGSLYYNVLAYMEKFLYRNASAVQGQSQEIIDHVKRMNGRLPLFLYRNLQPHSEQNISPNERQNGFRIVYAGLLGVAQDILSLIKHIDFKKIGAELHIYGGGNQVAEIEDYLKNNDTGVFYHGYISKEEINRILPTYQASIVPLAVRIKGAVPSKIFDLLPHGVPILFCGGGEGADILNVHGLGMVSEHKKAAHIIY